MRNTFFATTLLLLITVNYQLSAKTDYKQWAVRIADS